MPVAAFLLGLAALASAADANVRAPEAPPALRPLDLAESSEAARTAVDKPAATAERTGNGACRAWGPANPVRAKAVGGFSLSSSRPASAALKLVRLEAAALPERAQGSGEIYRQLPYLFSGFFTGPSGVVEVAESEAADGTSCPVFVSVGSGERRHTYWRYAPLDEPEGWFDERGRRLGGAALAQPRPGSRISSTFGIRRYYGRVTSGAFHDGIDFEAKVGDAIYAAADGTIEHQGWYFEYGLTTKIQHAPQFTTLYAHMARFAPGVGVGSTVRKGQLIGYVGMTGRSTGAHLHFSALAGGRFVDPAPYLLDQGGPPLGSASLATFRKWRSEVEALIQPSEPEAPSPPAEFDWTTRT